MLHYEVSGVGRGMILLHGWGQNMEMMEPIANYFHDHYRILNIDLPGFYGSDAPDEVWGSKEYADLIYQLVIQEKLDQPIIIAHSFGARIAFQYALHYPTTCMILTGAAGIRNKRNIFYYLKVWGYHMKKKLHLITGQEGSLDYQQANEIMKKILVKVVNEDITSKLKAITVPTLLVWGECDTQTPLWMGKKMEKEMPNATLIELKGDDHFAYFHQMNRFLKIINAYLNGVVK